MTDAELILRLGRWVETADNTYALWGDNYRRVDGKYLFIWHLAIHPKGVVEVPPEDSKLMDILHGVEERVQEPWGIPRLACGGRTSDHIMGKCPVSRRYRMYTHSPRKITPGSGLPTTPVEEWDGEMFCKRCLSSKAMREVLGLLEEETRQC